ncbi:MAG TPA: GNAT family N-acetyltransferase [Cyclobacteriaceae bacterium]|nr:GNAT family N-acetyltransferase [Cyclobacteriaceae bacterium]
MKFRDATIEDLPAIVEIYNSTVGSRMVTADTQPVKVEQKKKWFEGHSVNKRPLWVIEDEGRLIGWISLQSFYGRPAYDSTCEISIYIHESERGKGVGKKALQFAMDNCRRFNVKTLLGFIFEHNVPSLQLFKDSGFEQWARLPDIAELDGHERTLVIVGRKI